MKTQITYNTALPFKFGWPNSFFQFFHNFQYFHFILILVFFLICLPMDMLINNNLNVRYRFLLATANSNPTTTANNEINPAATDLKDQLTIGVAQEFGAFNPINNNLASVAAFSHFVLRSVTNRFADGHPVPEVAETLPTKTNGLVKIITSHSTKKVVAIWKLKKNATWGDGTPITCADWKLGWQVGQNDNVSTSDRSSYDKIQNIEWPINDNKKCEVTYATDSWTYDRDLPALLPAHLESKTFSDWKNQKEAYDQNSIYVKDPTNPGLYNGPYLIKEFKLGSHVIFVANPNYWGEKAKIKKIVLKYIPDSKTLKLQLEAGAIDMISKVAFPPDMALNLSLMAEKSNTKYKVDFNNSPLTQVIVFNLEDPILKNIEVRKAIHYAIDKQELTKSFFNNKLEPAFTLLSRKNQAFIQRKSEFSLKNAKQILESAGWKLNEKNIREKNGTELKIIFRTSAGFNLMENIQVYICSSFKKIGIDCIIKNQPPRVFLGQSVPHGDFGIAMFGTSVTPDSSLKSSFYSESAPKKENSFAGQNNSHWKNSAVDQFLLKFDQEWNSKKRTQILKKIESYIYEELPILPLYHRKEAVLTPKNLIGFEEDLEGTNFIYPEKWRLQ